MQETTMKGPYLHKIRGMTTPRSKDTGSRVENELNNALQIRQNKHQGLTQSNEVCGYLPLPPHLHTDKDSVRLL